MKPIANRSIWLETQAEIFIRWFDGQTDEVQVQAVSPETAEARVVKRSDRAIEFCKVTLPKQIKNSREWETRWEPKKIWHDLKQRFDDLGYDVIMEEGTPTSTSVRLNALHESDREAVILSKIALESILKKCLDSGLTLELNVSDIAIYQLALEYYFVQAPRMGNLPRAWVDDLASHVFARKMTGMPFSLFVLSFIGEGDFHD